MQIIYIKKHYNKRGTLPVRNYRENKKLTTNKTNQKPSGAKTLESDLSITLVKGLIYGKVKCNWPTSTSRACMLLG